MSQFLPGIKNYKTNTMIIILKLQILHFLKKMIFHILVQIILLKKRQKVTNNDDEYREETSKIQDGNESVDNYETSDTFRDVSIIKTSM